MALEMVCGQCQGRFLAEVPDSVVLCPHCGSHLQTPTAETWPDGSLGETLPVPATEQATPVSQEATLTSTPAPESDIFDAPLSDSAQTRMIEVGEDPGFVPPAETAVEETLVQTPTAPSPLKRGADEDVTGLTETWSPADPPARSFAAWDTSVPGGNDLYPDFSSAAQEASPTKAFSPESHPMLQRPGDPPPFPATVAFSPESHPMLQRPAFEDASTPRTPAMSGDLAGRAEFMAAVTPQPVRAPAPATARPPAEPGVSRFAFRLVVSYASAVTLAALYLLWQSTGKGDLESLPDLEPPRVKGREASMLGVPPSAPMNPGHTLRLGESERFGSVRVTPLKVVREPIEFVHFDPSVKFEHGQTAPVLKLYLKFENVSVDQEFRPLDDKLVYNRQPDKKRPDLYRANNFVCNAGDKSDASKLILMYHRSPTDSFDVKGQNLSTEMKPGQTYETFLATTEEGLETLQGDLLWRVHFRKGYNPTSGRGVTTVIEVAFHTSEVLDATGSMGHAAQRSSPKS